MKIETTTEKGPRLMRVTEAAVQVQDGEDLHELCCKIGDGARAAVRAFLAAEILAARDGDKPTPWVYTDKIFADFAIVEAETYGSGVEERYYRVPWSRNADGSFAFGAVQQVEEITTYEPVAPAAPAPMVMEAKTQKAQNVLGLMRQSVILGGTMLRADAERAAESLLHGVPAGDLTPVRETLAALRSGDRSKVLALTATAR